MDTDADPHRPRALCDMAGASDWKRLESMVRRPDPPHVVVVGGAGIGKSCAIRLCLGSAISVWLRCSQDPTLRDNRDRIKTAARRRVEVGQINWIVLEHADALHADAQAFLRRIIETTLGSSRFVLEVREGAAIAEPLLSRTVLFNAPQLVEYEVRAEVLRRSPALSVKDATRFARESDGNVRWAVLQGLGSMQQTQGLGSLQKTQVGSQQTQGLGSMQQTQVGSQQTQVGSQQTLSNSGFVGVPKETPATWADVLRIMEAIQTSGTSPRAYSSQSSEVWDRPGGICPWSLLALELSKGVH